MLLLAVYEFIFRRLKRPNAFCRIEFFFIGLWFLYFFGRGKIYYFTHLTSISEYDFLISSFLTGRRKSNNVFKDYGHKRLETTVLGKCLPLTALSCSPLSLGSGYMMGDYAYARACVYVCSRCVQRPVDWRRG